jgi:hypothetical protein
MRIVLPSHDRCLHWDKEGPPNADIRRMAAGTFLRL